jgi:hypothetical protein
MPSLKYVNDIVDSWIEVWNGQRSLSSLFFEREPEIRIDQMNELAEEEWMPKLYIVGRNDLPAGAQACQAIHATREFQEKHPEAERKWYKDSNHVALLAVDDEATLRNYIYEARRQGILYAVFHEPDLDNQLTAVVFDATLESRTMLQSVKSALKQNWYGGIRK